MYSFEQITNETLQEFKDKKEISMFKSATEEPCEMQDFVMITYQFKDEKGSIVAFATFTFEEGLLTIDEFEVLHSLRGKGIGKSIVNQIQNMFGKIELYPRDADAIEFWRKCGFDSSRGDCGDVLMTWQKK